jgi:hypothetical protein
MSTSDWADILKRNPAKSPITPPIAPPESPILPSSTGIDDPANINPGQNLPEVGGSELTYPTMTA